VSLDPRLLEILCCPATGQALRAPDSGHLAAINRAIAAGSVLLAGGGAARDRLSDCLLTADARRAYPVLDGIPVLLVDQALLLPPGTEAA